MATKLLYDLEPATLAEIEAAMRPFIERFVVVEKRERAVSLFLPIKKRARPRDLVDIIDQRTVIALDTSARAEAALARVDNELEGIYIVGKPAVFRARLGRAREICAFGYSDEEIFIAFDGAGGFVNVEIGFDLLIALPQRS